MKTLDKRFFAKVHMTSGCWSWTGGKGRGGYGSFYARGKTVRAHRFSYEQMVGPIPKGMTLDHLCGNPWCVRPDHLEPATLRDNILRGGGLSAQNARKTHCTRGHEFTPENTYSGRGYRGCKTCRAMHHRKDNARRRGLRHAQKTVQEWT